MIHKQTPRPTLDTSGMTLVEVLVSLAIFSILLVTGTSLMAFINKQAGSLNDNVAIANAMNQVKYAFGDDERYCEKILGRLPGGTPRSFSPTNTSGVAITTVDFYDLVTNQKKENAVAVGQKIEKKSGVIVQDIRLKPVSALSSRLVLASLDVTFKKDATSPTTIVRKIPIHITLQGSNIKKCSAGLATSLVAERKCEMDHNGYYYWDYEAETCKPLAGVEKFPGPTAFEATCPAGWHPATSIADPYAKKVCNAEVDKGPNITPRTYRSGLVDESDLIGFDSFLDVATNKCSYVYYESTFSTDYTTSIECAKNGVVR